MATYSGKVLKGEELFYYTTKIRAKLKEIEDRSREEIERLDERIDSQDSKILNLEDCKLELFIADGYRYNGDNLILIKDGQDIEPSIKYMYLVPAEDLDPATETPQPNHYNEYVWTPTTGYDLVGATDIDLDELTDSEVEDIWDEYFRN